MFKQVVKINDKYYIRRLSFFGWEYYDEHQKGFFWWPIHFIKNATAFSSAEEAEEYKLPKVTVIRRY